MHLLEYGYTNMKAGNISSIDINNVMEIICEQRVHETLHVEHDNNDCCTFNLVMHVDGVISCLLLEDIVDG